jgi:NADH-quinone oxidoreductase subunit J
MLFQEAMFWLLAVATIVGALGVVLLRDVFRAALLLVLVFIGVAGSFVLMNAEFLAVVQVLIYGGAVAILIIFAIMLTREVQQGNLPNRLQIGAVALPALLLAALVFAALDTDWNLLNDSPPDIVEQAEMVQTNTVAGLPDEAREVVGPSADRSGIGELLINDFALPFEVAAALLLAAIVGALALVRERNSGT